MPVQLCPCLFALYVIWIRQPKMNELLTLKRILLNCKRRLKEFVPTDTDDFGKVVDKLTANFTQILYLSLQKAKKFMHYINIVTCKHLITNSGISQLVQNLSHCYQTP